MKTVKWGIVGPGNIARNFARDLQLITSSYQKVHAVLGHSEKKATQFAEEFNVPHIYYTLEEFVQSGIDVVYIASPHASHFDHVMGCLQNRIPVLCEKPLTINANQTLELIDTAKINNTFLMEGLWLRFLPSIRLLLKLIGAGKIGKIIAVKASISYKAPQDPKNRYFNPSLGGGSLLDIGIYPVFLAYLLLGKPDTIKAIGSISDEGVDESCSVLFQYKNGQHATLESTLLAQSEAPAEIIGEKGVIRILNQWYQKSSGIEVSLYNEGKVILPCHWNGHGLHFEIEEVLKCLDNDKTESDFLPHHFSLGLMMLMDKIRSQLHVVYEVDE